MTKIGLSIFRSLSTGKLILISYLRAELSLVYQYKCIVFSDGIQILHSIQERLNMIILVLEND